MASDGIVNVDYWREHVQHNIVTTEQALTFLDDIVLLRAECAALRAELQRKTDALQELAEADMTPGPDPRCRRCEAPIDYAPNGAEGPFGHVLGCPIAKARAALAPAPPGTRGGEPSGG